MQIKLRNPKELLEHFAPYNPRRITEAEMRKLEQSIRTFGFVLPVVINIRTGNIVKGHESTQAAANIGLEQIPTTEVDLTEREEKALNIAFNRIRGKFDVEKLHGIFSDLTQKGADIELSGFDKTEIQEIASLVGHLQGERAPIEQLVVFVSKKDATIVREALRKAKGQGEFKEYEAENQNSNGNALARIAETLT